MTTGSLTLDRSERETAFYRLYRSYFDVFEKTRRWSLSDDIPWSQCRRNLAPHLVDVVETFCLIKMYVMDYVAKIIPLVRASYGRAWFFTNWGYEELKHALALSDWLLQSGQRREEQMTALEETVSRHEWHLPNADAVGMLVYSMVQESAAALGYRNLLQRVRGADADPALVRSLELIAADEQAQYGFLQECVQFYLKFDAAAVLEQLRRVLRNFTLPAVAGLPDGRRRQDALAHLEIINDEMYERDVYRPILASLGVHPAEIGIAQRVLTTVDKT